MNMKRIGIFLLALLMVAACVPACAKTPAEPKEPKVPVVTEAPAATETPEQESAAVTEEEPDIGLPDGEYDAKFVTDSSMFHVNEANKGMGVLTVKDGKAVMHVSLVSKTILNLFQGTAEDAQKDGAVLLEPTLDTVTYDDGESEEVFGFDIPVTAIGEDFDLAIIGTKGKWYDHKVSVQDPQPRQ